VQGILQGQPAPDAISALLTYTPWTTHHSHTEVHSELAHGFICYQMSEDSAQYILLSTII